MRLSSRSGYDTAGPESSTIEDAAGRTLSINPSLLWGRAASVSDLGSKRVLQYDAKGRRMPYSGR